MRYGSAKTNYNLRTFRKTLLSLRYASSRIFPAPVPLEEELEERHVLRRLGLSLGQAMLLFAGLVGLTAGLAAAAFYQMLHAFVNLSLHAHAEAGHAWTYVIIALTPAAGGLVCGLLLHYFAPDARGGVSEVIDALLHRDGFIRFRVGVIKTLASVVCIGSGGSAGREGPVVQIGAAVGSTLAQVFRVTRRRAQLLVACGAAGGIAAVFNAPIAGAFFAAEIITGRFEMRDLSLLFTASAMGAAVARVLLKERAAFQTPSYEMVAVWALGFHALLGVACAVLGQAFVQGLHQSEAWFARLRMHPALKPALGGLLVGLIGILIPQVFGTGGEVLQNTLQNPEPAIWLLLWAFAKLISTSLTLGSGGSGGDLMPSLFLGGSLGGAYGQLIHYFLPASTMPAGAYAVVGAAALFGGVAHAPITAIILGFEMGGNYGVVLPLMVSCSISALVSRRLSSSSLYTLKLKRKGVDIERLRSLRSDPLDLVKVSEVMSSSVPGVSPELSIPELLEKFATSGRHGFLVMREGRLVGIVTLSDAQAALDGSEAGKRVEDIASRNVVVCFPDDTLNQALHRLGAREVGRMPVVEPDRPYQVQGVIHRSDILRAYRMGVTRGQ